MGERGLLVEAGTRPDVQRLWSSLRADPPPGVEEVVAGASTVLVLARPGADLDRLVVAMRNRSPGSESGPAGRRVTIPVAYGGPDLQDVADLAGLSANEVVARHCSATYEAAFVGFSPGFAYLAGVPSELRVPRLATPRRKVPAGSVALAGEMTAVYPQPTPGGWRLIGRTTMQMFDPQRPEPSALLPGDRVRFEPAQLDPGSPAAAAGPRTRSLDGAHVAVLEAGPLTTIQDGGRIGWAHVGVPRAGALDRRAAAFANRMVGNPPTAALLEVAFGGLQAALADDRRVCITGARASVTVDGLPGRQDAALPLPAGCRFAVGPVEAGARVYVAIEGGVDAEPVLGSRSTDTLSGLGPPRLSDGDALPLGARHRGQPSQARGPTPARYPVAGDLIEVAAHVGPRAAWIEPAGLDRLRGAEFVVEPASDRTGVRLAGPPLERRRHDELPTEGMVPGAIQVPPDGQPIVLMRNHPTTGGYPVVAVVDDAGVDALAQAGPGVRVRFRIHPADRA